MRFNILGDRQFVSIAESEGHVQDDGGVLIVQDPTDRHFVEIWRAISKRRNVIGFGKKWDGIFTFHPLYMHVATFQDVLDVMDDGL